MAKKQENPKDFILKKSEEVAGIAVEGYNFDKGVNYEQLIGSFSSTGYQATHFSKAVEIVNEMINNDSKIFLGYTSNMVSSGLRDIFRYLVKNKMVDVIVTTGGGVEEDIIKCLGKFIVGRFDLKGKELREKGINRIGNILVPNSRYLEFEKFVQPLFKKLLDEQEKSGKTFTPSELIWRVGEAINNEQSIYYWAWKNRIPVYCPAILDGSLGDMLYFFNYQQDKKLRIDLAEDTRRLNDSTLGLKKSGVILLGAGVVKHSILNAHLYRNGADYAVYINTAQEFDGSDAGAMPEEAVSWGKIGISGSSIKISADATLVFPLLVAETFAKEKRKVNFPFQG